MNEHILPLVSIVIPVYNGENTIEKTLKSVFQQSYNNIEIIVVNDGSRDNTIKILEKYKDSIKIINKENGGVSSARNCGIEHSNGTYVVFVDSDDICADNMIECMMKNQKENNVDFVIASFTRIKGGKELVSSVGNDVVCSKKEIRDNIRHILINGLNSPCSKLYKREILKEKNIKFDESLPLGEDMNFNLEYVLEVDSMSYVNTSVYYYLEENSVASKRYRKNYYECRMASLKKMNETLSKNNMINPFNTILHIKIVYGSIFNLHKKECSCSYGQKINDIRIMQQEYRYFYANNKNKKITNIFKILQWLILHLNSNLLYVCSFIIENSLRVLTVKINRGISV